MPKQDDLYWRRKNPYPEPVEGRGDQSTPRQRHIAFEEGYQAAISDLVNELDRQFKEWDENGKQDEVLCICAIRGIVSDCASGYGKHRASHNI